MPRLHTEQSQLSTPRRECFIQSFHPEGSLVSLELLGKGWKITEKTTSSQMSAYTAWLRNSRILPKHGQESFPEKSHCTGETQEQTLALLAPILAVPSLCSGNPQLAAFSLWLMGGIKGNFSSGSLLISLSVKSLQLNPNHPARSLPWPRSQGLKAQVTLEKQLCKCNCCWIEFVQA